MILESNIFVYNNVITKEDVGDMKFDVVVGNPPYNHGDNLNARTKPWPAFVRRALQLLKPGGAVAMVTPRSWITNNKLYSEFFLSTHPIYINIDECRRHFPGVNSTFSYYVLTDTSDQKCTIVTSDNQFVLDQLPEVGLGSGTPEAVQLLSKLINGRKRFSMITSSGYNTSKFSQGDTSISKTRTKEHQYPVLHKTLKGEDLFFYAKKLDLTIHNVPRVIVSTWVGHYDNMRVSDTLLTCQDYRHFPVNSILQAKHLRTVLLSPIYKFIAKILAAGNRFTNDSMNHFPVVDLTRSWTDEELYEHFNLTQEEIALIEETIKDPKEKPVANAKADTITTGSSSRKGSKMEAARNLLINNGKLVTTSRKEAIAMMVKAGIGMATASTYWQTIKKNV
jgi:site-specific DNA-methyltransferase (adenine-specific)